ncbi:MAG TPA: glycosyltransferase family 4 protein [Candidatus Nanoarchaeia archaeon]|nr:glycosyltransferase family 4 protein [Candidatus Nanoarchaeia archaeon]
MKIAKVTAFFSPVEGGMETHLLEETKELVKLGHQVTVYTSDSLREGRIAQRHATFNGVAVERLPTWFNLASFSPVFPSVYWKALTADYDIWHAHVYRQPHTLSLLFAKLRGKKTVLNIHWPEYPKSLRSFLMNISIPLFDWTLGPILLRLCDTLIVQTKTEEHWLRNKFGHLKNIIVLPPGIASSYLKKRNSAIFRKKHHIQGQMVLYVGRLHQSKGVHKLLAIAPDFPHVTFVFAGDGPERAALQHQIKAQHLNNVRLLGRVSEEEKMQAYASCDVFVHPTDYDAFGITLLEAMAQEKPILASRVGGIPSVLGTDGLTFAKDDLADLRKQLKRLLTNKNLQHTLGKRGRKKVEQFTWDKITQRLEGIYRSL